MNRKGTELLQSNIIYLVLVVIFVAIVGTFVWQQQSGAAIWEDYYVKQLGLLLDRAQPGDSFTLDVHKATEVARGNQVLDLTSIFWFDNDLKEVCAKFSNQYATCFAYYTDIDVAWRVDLAAGARTAKNVLVIDVGASS